MPSVRIVVDERERRSRIPELIMTGGGTVDFAQLPVGDYIVAPDEVVERKTVHDLLGSIFDGRLFVQCSELLKHFPRPVILIQGNIGDLDVLSSKEHDKDERHTEDRIPLIYESLATVITEFRIPIIHTPTAEHTARLLLTLATKNIRDGRASGPLLRKIRKGNITYVQQLSVLSSVPGIGEKLAARMLRKFGTPRRALNATAAELATIPGFGLARAERVRKILDSAESPSKAVQRTLFD